MSASSTPTEAAKPSADAPHNGTVTRAGVVISEVEHWHEDGSYFVRSTEFDCYAEDEDFKTAIDRFGETAEDLLEFLADAVRSGDATDNEREVFDLLAPRLLEAYKLELAEDERSRRLISVRVGRRRRRRRGAGSNWAPRTTPHSSSPPSLVS